MNPLVSVVVPTHGRPDFFRQALRSIGDQTYDPIELIVIDDASPEPVEPILDDIDTDRFDRVECLRHEENRGANAARNTGIDAASGQIIAFLDDDDRWLPTAVQRYVDAFVDGGQSVGVVTVGVRIVDEHGTQIGEALPSIEQDALGALLEGALVGSFSRFAVRADVIETAGPLDERLPCWQDWEIQFRLAFHCDFAAISEPLVVRTCGEHDQISDDFEQRRDVAYPMILERHRTAIRVKRGPRAERRFVALLSRSLAFSALETDRYREAFRYLFRSLRYDPYAPRTYLYMGLASGGPVTFGTARRIKRLLSGVGSTRNWSW